MRVVIVPCLSDNYAYLIIDDESSTAACVDPAEAALVRAAAEREGVSIVAVLTTHHHFDHAGGNADMAANIADLRVYGGAAEQTRVEACTDGLADGDTVNIGSVLVTALHTPGHTMGSMSYLCTEDGADAGCVFTGDTLFVGGCGRIMEGAPRDMYTSLQKLGELPPETRVYVGHEYTVKNLDFAAAVDPSNESVQQMVEYAKKARVQRRYTVPSTIQNEWLINPFLRSGDDTFMQACPNCTPLEVFARLRRQKDRF